MLHLHKIMITLMDSGKDESQCEQAMKPYLVHKNERSSSGCTPLHFAALNNDSSTVKILLKHGAKIFENKEGETPLHWACQAGNLSTIKTLMKHMSPANIMAEDCCGYTAADWAYQNENLEACLLLNSCAEQFQWRKICTLYNLYNKNGWKLSCVYLRTTNAVSWLRLDNKQHRDACMDMH